jgi:hypothetical protein
MHRRDLQDVVSRIARALQEYQREASAFEAKELAVLLMEKLHDEGLTIVPKPAHRRSQA